MWSEPSSHRLSHCSPTIKMPIDNSNICQHGHVYAEFVFRRIDGNVKSSLMIIVTRQTVSEEVFWFRRSSYKEVVIKINEMF